MTSAFDARGGVPPARTCGAYRYGHDVHFIQARLSWEAGPGVPNRVVAVDDDGTIHFADGTTRWNHDPERLRAILRRYGMVASVQSHGVLRIPNGAGVGGHYVSVSEMPDPCRPETAEVIPGESVLDELLRRGGVLRKIT